MKAHLTPRDLLLTLAVVAVWGYTFVPIKVALREVPPFALAAVRFALAALPLVFFIRRPAMPWRYVIGYGIAIGVLQFGLLFLGMKLGMPAGLSSLVIQLQVFFTIGLAVVLDGDRLQRHNLVGAGVAVAGVALLAAHKLGAGESGTFVGFLLVIASGLAWAVGNIIAKRGAGAHAPDMFALVVWSSLVPPLPLAALSYRARGRPGRVARGRRDERDRVGLPARDGVRRDAVRLRVVERAPPPLSDGVDLAVRAADPRVGPRERRAVPRRIARAAADGRRRARLRGPRRQHLRARRPAHEASDFADSG